MTKIYLIRSAQSEGDIYHFAQGHCDGNLTERGWRQVKALEKRFFDIRIDAVYTSDLYRACATASAIYKPKNQIAHRRKDLREIFLGNWEGVAWGNIAYTQAKQVGYFKTEPEKWHVEGAETLAQAAGRMRAAIREIAAQHTGKTVAVVSHGLIIRLFLAELQGIPWERAHTLSIAKHTAIALIEDECGVLRLVEQNDTSHLAHAFDFAYAAPDFNTDLYFYPLPRIGYGDIFADSVECVWEESGEDRPFDKEIICNELSYRTTFIGFLDCDPAGFLQLGPEPGWISLICTHPGCRKAGLGIQLIGQAVFAAREMGLDYLRIALPKQNPFRPFFMEYGFFPIGETQEGREILQKNIGFHPEYLKNDE